MIQFAAVKTFLGALPWKHIILAILIGGALFVVFKYIKTAEDNRNKVETLTTANSELSKANEALEAEYKGQLRVLQNNLKKEREREKDYAENIRIIREGPDGSCAVSSPAIAGSLRMRLDRGAGDPAR